MPLFLFEFLALMIVVHTLKNMKFIFYACECTHGNWDVGCELVMATGVGRGTSVL